MLKFRPLSVTVEPPVVAPFWSVWDVGTGASNVNVTAAAVPTIPPTVTTWYKGVDLGDAAGDSAHCSAVTDVQEVDAHGSAVAATAPRTLPVPTNAAVGVASSPYPKFTPLSVSGVKPLGAPLTAATPVATGASKVKK